jgi:hypothetical protein
MRGLTRDWGYESVVEGGTRLRARFVECVGGWVQAGVNWLKSMVTDGAAIQDSIVLVKEEGKERSESGRRRRGSRSNTVVRPARHMVVPRPGHLSHDPSAKSKQSDPLPSSTRPCVCVLANLPPSCLLEHFCGAAQQRIRARLAKMTASTGSTSCYQSLCTFGQVQPWRRSLVSGFDRRPYLLHSSKPHAPRSQTGDGVDEWKTYRGPR